MLWDGWITVRDALTFSYLQNTVLNDLAVVGGAVAIYEALRRGIGTAIDKVIAEELPNKPSAPYTTTRWRPQTRVIAVTPLMSPRQSIPQLLNRVDGRLDQVDKRLDQMETNFKAVDQLAAEIQKMRMEARRGFAANAHAFGACLPHSDWRCRGCSLEIILRANLI